MLFHYVFRNTNILTSQNYDGIVNHNNSYSTKVGGRTVSKSDLNKDALITATTKWDIRKVLEPVQDKKKCSRALQKKIDLMEFTDYDLKKDISQIDYKDEEKLNDTDSNIKKIKNLVNNVYKFNSEVLYSKPFGIGFKLNYNVNEEVLSKLNILLIVCQVLLPLEWHNIFIYCLLGCIELDKMDYIKLEEDEVENFLNCTEGWLLRKIEDRLIDVKSKKEFIYKKDENGNFLGVPEAVEINSSDKEDRLSDIKELETTDDGFKDIDDEEILKMYNKNKQADIRKAVISYNLQKFIKLKNFEKMKKSKGFKDIMVKVLKVAIEEIEYSYQNLDNDDKTKEIVDEWYKGAINQIYNILAEWNRGHFEVYNQMKTPHDISAEIFYDDNTQFTDQSLRFLNNWSNYNNMRYNYLQIMTYNYTIMMNEVYKPIREDNEHTNKKEYTASIYDSNGNKKDEKVKINPDTLTFTKTTYDDISLYKLCHYSDQFGEGEIIKVMFLEKHYDNHYYIHSTYFSFVQLPF